MLRLEECDIQVRVPAAYISSPCLPEQAAPWPDRQVPSGMTKQAFTCTYLGTPEPLEAPLPTTATHDSARHDLDRENGLTSHNHSITIVNDPIMAWHYFGISAE